MEGIEFYTNPTNRICICRFPGCTLSLPVVMWEDGLLMLVRLLVGMMWIKEVHATDQIELEYASNFQYDRLTTFGR